MYTFMIYESETKPNETESLQRSPVSFEFTDIVKAEDGLNQKKLREIKKSRVELIKRKPRNMFMIFRGLVKHLILKKIPNGSFADVSKISSMAWSKRTPDLEKYVKYLSKQEETYQNRHCLNNPSLKKDEARTRSPLNNASIVGFNCRVFKHYQVTKSRSKSKPHHSVTTRKLFPGKFRIEDIYVNSV
ncbi:hypothetical protein PICMEDRAFT_13902 [Pichia membranifaciens NRRL Y-2026]|uniref:HMG box domain-containing protein n=1 Tax=Pichia membranifaciens NRRL Y-2026 TaxID=763406 RepID=A0A1E3NDF5_9ASCO|nr:hypothetical protein PICMEDRAFT_13902 [Pichia membranifaciens NRRL Y-2026]ODQ44152.1 hypothetical protein PICMEDRAFT_13902 [Pichia membranifaciens NRRL Y-2026]